MIALQEENTLIDQVLAGKQEPYALLVDHYKSYAFTIALKILNNRSDAEEVAQDAFIKAFHYLKNFNRQARFSTWLYRIVFNTAISHKRKNNQVLSSIENHDHALEEEETASFVTKVMRNLHSTAFPPSLSPRNGLLLVIGVLVTAGLLVALVSAGSFDQWTGFVSLEEVTPLKEYFRVSLPTVYINGKLLIKILVGLNLGLAFIVLDRTVLKPFFQRRAGSQY